MSSIKDKLKIFVPPSSRTFNGRAEQQLQLINELKNELVELRNEICRLREKSDVSFNEIEKRLLTAEMELNYIPKVKHSDLVRGMEKALAVSMINSDSFNGFKNKFAGRSVVVCATGQTLNYYEPIENAIHIGVNRAFLKKDLSFDFLFAQCWTSIFHCKNELMNYQGDNCIKFFGIEGVTWINGEVAMSGIPEDYAIACNAKRYVTDFFARGERCFDWSIDLCSQSISTGWSSALPAIQFALYTNPERIYLVGCDTSIPGHFTEETCDSEYTELTRRLYMTEVPKMKECFESIKLFATRVYPDIEIVSINPIGLKGLFKDEYTDKYPLKEKIEF